MPTKIVKEVWVADDGSEHATEEAARRRDVLDQLADLFRGEFDYPEDFASSILFHADDIARILTTTTPE